MKKYSSKVFFLFALTVSTFNSCGYVNKLLSLGGIAGSLGSAQFLLESLDDSETHKPAFRAIIVGNLAAGYICLRTLVNEYSQQGKRIIALQHNKKTLPKDSSTIKKAN